MLAQYRDTELIDRYLAQALGNTEMVNFKVRMLRDAAFLEKVFLQKLSLEADDDDLLNQLLAETDAKSLAAFLETFKKLDENPKPSDKKEL